MRVQGRIFKDGRFWLAEVPILDVMTQGFTRKEVLGMVKDLVESLADRPGFLVTVHSSRNGGIEVGSDDVRGMVALILRRQRAPAACPRRSRGAPRRQVAQRLCTLRTRRLVADVGKAQRADGRDFSERRLRPAAHRRGGKFGDRARPPALRRSNKPVPFNGGSRQPGNHAASRRQATDLSKRQGLRSNVLVLRSEAATIPVPHLD